MTTNIIKSLIALICVSLVAACSFKENIIKVTTQAVVFHNVASTGAPLEIPSIQMFMADSGKEATKEAEEYYKVFKRKWKNKVDERTEIADLTADYITLKKHFENVKINAYNEKQMKLYEHARELNKTIETKLKENKPVEAFDFMTELGALTTTLGDL